MASSDDRLSQERRGLALVPAVTRTLSELRLVDAARIRQGIDAPASPTKATRQLHAIRQGPHYDHLLRTYIESRSKRGWRKTAEIIWTFSGWRATIRTVDRSHPSRAIDAGQSAWVHLDPDGTASVGCGRSRPLTLEAAAHQAVLHYFGYTSPYVDGGPYEYEGRYEYETSVVELYERTITLIAGYLAASKQSRD